MARRIVDVTGTINGTNTTFTTPNAFDPDTLFIVVDGQHIAASDTRGATVTGSTSFTTKEVLVSGQVLYASIDDLTYSNVVGYEGEITYTLTNYNVDYNVTNYQLDYNFATYKIKL